MEHIKEAANRDAAAEAKYFRNLPPHWWRHWPEFRRYLLFGVLNTLLTYIIYLMCLRFGSYRVAYTVSFVSGILISYLFNSHFVFKKELRVTKALQFIVVYVVQYFVGLGFLFILIDVAHLSKVFAPVLLVLLIVPTNYCLNRRIIGGGSR
jgi:putative flippase GtrA